MKILDPQVTVLTNDEVFKFLRRSREEDEQHKRGEQARRAAAAESGADISEGTKFDLRGLKTIDREIENYITRIAPRYNSYPTLPAEYFDIHRPESPVNDYGDPEANYINELMFLLKPYKLKKAEMLGIFNLRPQDPAVLDCLVEEMNERYTDEKIEEILGHIKDILGRDPEPEGEEGEDEEEEEAKGGERDQEMEED